MSAPIVLAAALSVLAGCDYDAFCIECSDGGSDVDGSSPGDGAVRDGGGDAGAPDSSGVCTPNDEVEACNGLDDNCDGEVDEGFDLAADARNCGSCGNICQAENGESECADGDCRFVACFEGFVDLEDVGACSYRCPVFPPTDETCNGVDDDCDGEVDERADLPPGPTGLCRDRPGTPCQNTGVVCATREGRTTWFCDYAEGVEHDPRVPNGIVDEETLCDGADGDCDGDSDEPFADLGVPCDNGLLGACRDEGEIRCDGADPSRTGCDFSVGVNPVPGAPGVELCNAIDDNCDGIVDNADPDDPERVREDMRHVVQGGLDFWIYAYEASRPDAAASSAGISSARACSAAGRLPWATVGYEAARSACEAAGHRLCTGQEWQAACEGADGSAYPYGHDYETALCNGGDRDAIAGGAVDHVLATTGGLAMCVSDDGALDLSGNLKEWTNDPRGASAAGTPIYVTRGGSYQSPELGLRCQTDLSRATADTALPSLGFRCCSSTGP